MGGYGASIIALHHPQLFASVVSVAGYFKLDDDTGAFSTYQKREMQEPANYLKAAKQLRWLLIQGKYDDTYPVAGQAKAWSAMLTAQKIKNKVLTLPGGHSSTLISTAALTISKWLNMSLLPIPQSNPTSTPAVISTTTTTLNLVSSNNLGETATSTVTSNSSSASPKLG
jgi:S-formylglutathione hydrolase FrmB